ncbi:hypothetical protein CEP51_002368 [Fusarium floridanum]|uniref:NACHT domain-containing protein n=1 Tax=Fusarium floridanum TaxID=1325733 RepID=A0A428SBN6_9HYPO|nr:hypothetical protein CEP51_002368 [Fusarium floridanum]
MKRKLLQVLRPKRSSRSPSPASERRQDTPPHPAPSQSGPSVPTPAPITPELQVSAAIPAVRAPDDLIRTRIWNSAYEKVKEDEPSLVEAYEKILSAQLSSDEPAQLDRGSINVIKQDADARQDQMKQLVDKGLEKTERVSNIKEKVKEGMQPIKNVKDFVALAVKTEPSAAVAWVGITACMEIITNPVTEPGINRDGVKHVLETVQWYWELSDLLDADGADESTIKLQELLEKHIVSLYKKLLVYQMQSVCLYNKHWAAVLVRDLVKIDDWQEKVGSIKNAEEALRQKIKQKNSEILKSRLACIDDKLRHLRLDVQAVTSAVGGVELAVNEQTRGLLKMHYDDKDNECLRDLYIINPQTHKQRLEKTKGGLLKDSYRWILDHDDFRRFRSDPERRLFWIKGDPGKGKTMLLCGIIDELERESTHPLSYFFCQATQDHLRSAISVLRSLIWLLCKKQPTLMPCVREAYDMEGKKCFEEFFSLKGILESMLQLPCLQTAVLIVDALDECSYQRQEVVEREELIDLIIELSENSSAKWIVSSRNWPVIEGQFRPADKIAVSLELNNDSISRAVETFVRYKTDELARIKPFDNQTKDAVLQRLLLGANDTFLWVALVCKELARPIVKPWEALAKIYQLRTGLNDLYERMLEHIVASDYSELCREILAIACVAYRPLSLDELRALVPELQAYGSEALRDLIGECGSFLTIQEDVIYFVHQSAQDFLVGNGKGKIFPSGTQEQHRVLFRRSLEALKVLRRDIYGLKSPGVSVKDIIPSDPDPLSPLKYAILYWIDHLGQFQGDQDISDDEAIYKFLRGKYLYWLEALILKNLIGQGSEKIERLRAIVRCSNVTGLSDLVNDAWRFVYSHLEIISEAPLQLYGSALLFSPTGSMIRQLFAHDEPSWLVMKPRTRQNWSPCLLKLNLLVLSEKKRNRQVVISPNGRTFVRLEDDAVEIHNIGWSDMTHSIKLADSAGSKASFAPNGEHLAVGSDGGVIRLLDTKTGRRVWEFVGHKDRISALASSPNGKLLASASPKGIIILDLSTGHRLRTLGCESQRVMSFSVDSQRLASASFSMEITLWDVTTGVCTWTTQAHDKPIGSLAFVSRDSLVSSSNDKKVKIWDLAKKACTQTLQTDCESPSVVSLQDGSRFVYFSTHGSRTATVCNEQGICLQTITMSSHLDVLVDFVFLPGLQLLARTSRQALILWDLASKSSEQDDVEVDTVLYDLVLSYDGKYLASCSENCRVRLWDTSASTYHPTLDVSQSVSPGSITFSDDGRLLITKQSHHGLLVWDTADSNCLGTCDGGRWELSLSSDGRQLALESAEDIMIHDLATGDCMQKIKSDVRGRQFLVNANQLVLASDKDIKVLDIPQSRCIASLSIPSSPEEAVGDNCYRPRRRTRFSSQASSAVETRTIYAVALSNDSNFIAVDDHDSTQVWDLITQTLHYELNFEAKSLTFFPDGQLMLYNNRARNTVEILKLKTGTLLRSIQLPRCTWQREWRLDPDDQSRLCTEFGVIDLTDTSWS